MTRKERFFGEVPPSVNLVWITKNQVLQKLEPSERSLLIPNDVDKFPIVSQLQAWQQINPQVNINLWLNFAENSEGASKLKTQLSSQGIAVRNILDLTELQQLVTFDDEGRGQLVPLGEVGDESSELLNTYLIDHDWILIDLIKIFVLYHALKNERHALSIYSDIDIKPFEIGGNFLSHHDDFVFLGMETAGSALIANNGFFAFKNTEQGLLALEQWRERAISDALNEGKNAFFSLNEIFQPLSHQGEIPIAVLNFRTKERQHDGAAAEPEPRI